MDHPHLSSFSCVRCFDSLGFHHFDMTKTTNDAGLGVVLRLFASQGDKTPALELHSECSNMVEDVEVKAGHRRHVDSLTPASDITWLYWLYYHSSTIIWLFFCSGRARENEQESLGRTRGTWDLTQHQQLHFNVGFHCSMLDGPPGFVEWTAAYSLLAVVCTSWTQGSQLFFCRLARFSFEIFGFGGRQRRLAWSLATTSHAEVNRCKQFDSGPSSGEWLLFVSTFMNLLIYIVNYKPICIYIMLLYMYNA